MRNAPQENEDEDVLSSEETRCARQTGGPIESHSHNNHFNEQLLMRPNTELKDLQHRTSTGQVIANEHSSVSGSPAPEDQAMADAD